MHRNVYKHRALIQDFHFLFVTVALPCAAAFWGPCTRPFSVPQCLHFQMSGEEVTSTILRWVLESDDKLGFEPHLCHLLASDLGWVA